MIPPSVFDPKGPWLCDGIINPPLADKQVVG